MSAATRERITAAMRELDYHPNSVARGLRSKQTRTLGFLVVDDSAHFLADPMTDLFLAGLGDLLRERSYELLVRSVGGVEKIDDLLEPLYGRRLDAAVVLLSGVPEERRRWSKALAAIDVPILLLQEHGGQAPAVTADDRRGAQVLCQHLFEGGRRRLAFVTAERHWSAIEERFAGFLDAHTEAKIRPRKSQILWTGGFDPLAAASRVTTLLKRADRPDAVLCGNDLLALGVIRVARQLGLRVPEDVAVTGFDDFGFAVATTPAITTVRIPGYQMGRYAAEELLRAAAGGDPAQGRHFPTELCLRESA